MITGHLGMVGILVGRNRCKNRPGYSYLIRQEENLTYNNIAANNKAMLILTQSLDDSTHGPVGHHFIIIQL